MKQPRRLESADTNEPMACDVAGRLACSKPVLRVFDRSSLVIAETAPGLGLLDLLSCELMLNGC